jgi:very-short-patch-repair endonuclease
MARLAARQHGVVSHEQLVAMGIRGSGIARRVGRGHLHRLHTGVFAVGHENVGPDGLRLAAAMAAGPDAVVSHPDAAALFDLLDHAPAVVHVTTPHRPRRGPAGIRLHRTRSLHPDDVTEVRGIPVTSVARLLVDLTDEMGVDDLARLLREAAYLRLLDLPAIDAAISRAHGRRRLSRVRAALDAHRPASILRSELESRFLELCRDGGLAEPETNVRVRAGRRSYEVDCLWRAQRVVVELDGAAAHATARAFEADRERDAALMAAGYRTLRYTWRRLSRDPEAVIRELAATLFQGPGAA